MKPADVFGLVVRVVGFLLVLSSLWPIFWALTNWALGGPQSPLGLMIVGFPTMAVGLILLGCAEAVVAFAYGQR